VFSTASSLRFPKNNPLKMPFFCLLAGVIASIHAGAGHLSDVQFATFRVGGKSAVASIHAGVRHFSRALSKVPFCPNPDIREASMIASRRTVSGPYRVHPSSFIPSGRACAIQS
jgi:hypothetical protein